MQSESDNITLQVYPHQVSGKEPKLLSHDLTKIYKGYNPTELKFYETVFNVQKQSGLKILKSFVPAFYGKLSLSKEPELQVHVESESTEKEWLNHLASRYRTRNQNNSFIVMENLTYNFKKPCVFDIKIGGRNVDGKKHKHVKPVSTLFIKLNGCRLLNVKGKDLLFSKYFLAKIIEEQQITEYLAFFLSVNDKIQEEILDRTISKLRAIKEGFGTIRGYKFISTSLCFIYDQQDYAKTDVRVIDFGRLTQEQDKNFVDQQSQKGIENVLRMLEGIAQRKQQFEKAVLKVREHCLSENVMEIPEEKRSKPTSSTSV